MRRLSATYEKMSVRDYINHLYTGTIVIPPFQRRGGIWNDKKKSHFILSQIFYFTTPLILKETNQSGETKYHIIDGLQRTNSLLSFINDMLKLSYDFSLLGSEINNEMLIDFIHKTSNKKFSEIEETYKEEFLNSEVNLIILKETEKTERENLMEEMIYLFKVINTGTPLNKTELRYAIYYSPNIAKINEHIRTNSEYFSKVFKIKMPHKRMKDLDLFLRMLGIYIFGKEIVDIYRGYDNLLNIVASELYEMKDDTVDMFFEKLIEIIKHMYNEKLDIKVLLNKNYCFFDILGVATYVGLTGEETVEFINNLKLNEKFIENISERDNMKPNIFKERMEILLSEVTIVENKYDRELQATINS